MKHSLQLSIYLLLTGCVSSGTITSYMPRQGDIVFQSLPHIPVIDAIEGCTHSPYSHCGIVVKQDDVWYVLEAIGPVRITRLDRWIDQGREDAFAVCRLKPDFQPKVGAMITAAEKFIGLPYDIQYELDDEKIYCSELIYKGFKAATGQALGKIVKLGDLDWKPHAQVIRAIAGDPVPLEREIITPRDLAKAEQLEEVLPLEKHVVLSR
ncbi:MAG: YiiX/YebB-like N1pC/P60 family cysteine hydrolase [Prosthecobacter sp.]|uniref:YiiX/YebB-like N1pC/P60 family cysteine hydrolase n=1 Tax=Prosthecobacter sp. TaxID=1965333 RepID=UPI0038FE591E